METSLETAGLDERRKLCVRAGRGDVDAACQLSLYLGADSASVRGNVIHTHRRSGFLHAFLRRQNRPLPRRHDRLTFRAGFVKATPGLQDRGLGVQVLSPLYSKAARLQVVLFRSVAWTGAVLPIRSTRSPLGRPRSEH
jgi:hypothetical protein